MRKLLVVEHPRTPNDADVAGQFSRTSRGRIPLYELAA